MVAVMASGWRVDTKLDQPREGAWNVVVADEDNSARPCKCCLNVMEDRQMSLDILRSLEFDTMQGLWDFVKFHDAVESPVLSSARSSAIKGMGARKQH